MAHRPPRVGPSGLCVRPNRRRALLPAWGRRPPPRARVLARGAPPAATGAARRSSPPARAGAAARRSAGAARPRECEQPLDADQAGAFFVPVDLLVDGPDPLGELPLGQAERAPPLAQPGRDVAVGVALRVVPRHVGSRRSRSRREPRRGEGVPGCLPPGPSVGPPRGRLPYRPTGPASLAAAANSLAFRATPDLPPRSGRDGAGPGCARPAPFWACDRWPRPTRAVAGAPGAIDAPRATSSASCRSTAGTPA